jgi:hypothetical protein
LRQETSQRSSFQQALVALNLTAVGTIVGFVVTSRAPTELLLVIPIVSPTFGLLWLDHHSNIHRIARYVQQELWVWTPSWEAHHRNHPHPVWWAVVFWIAILLIFFIVSVAALVLGWPGPNGPAGTWLLWGGGATLCGLYFVAWFHAVFR